MDDPYPSIIAAGLGLCLLVLAFTSAVDAAFTAISRHRLNALLADNTPRARLLARLLDEPYRFKATIILLNAGVTIAATAFTLYLTAELLLWQKVAAMFGLLLAILVVSEALPKALAVRRPDQTAVFLAPLLNAVARLLWPLIAAVGFVTRPLVRLLNGGGDAPSMPLVTEEELRLLVNVGEEEGLIEHEEREMIEGIFSFGDTLVSEVMVPRIDISALDVNTPFDQALDLVIGEGLSRIPVFDETVDNIIGILYSKDLLPALRNGRYDMPIRTMLRPAHFVPETLKVDALLADMQQRKVHMAIVVDEYGGTAGLVTLEDLLEEIVGEIQDEYDAEEPWVQIVNDHELVADARVPIDEINDLTGLHLESADADRMGGLVYEQLGRVPHIGDEVHYDSGTVITVLSVKGVRPQKLRIAYQRPLELDLLSELLSAEQVEGEPRGPT